MTTRRYGAPLPLMGVKTRSALSLGAQNEMG